MAQWRQHIYDLAADIRKREQLGLEEAGILANIGARDRLIVALDVPTIEAARALVAQARRRGRLLQDRSRAGHEPAASTLRAS